MKVGLIVEGIPDAQVCEYLAGRIKPNIKVRTLPLGAKPQLLKRCGRIANLLLEEGYDRVVIVWDLYPARWEIRSKSKQKGKAKAKPTCKQDCHTIVNKLQDTGADLNRVYLVCIETMLEIWLLIDIRAINNILSTKTRASGIRKPPHLDRNQDPKSLMINMFENVGKTYSDVDDAIRIAKAIPEEPDDLKRLKKLDSFLQFARAITEV